MNNAIKLCRFVYEINNVACPNHMKEEIKTFNYREDNKKHIAYGLIKTGRFSIGKKSNPLLQNIVSQLCEKKIIKLTSEYITLVDYNK